MRPIARQCSRLVKRNRASNFIRATPIAQRPLHCTSTHRQGSRPPNGDAREDNQPVEHEKEEETRAEAGASKTDETKDAEQNGDGRTPAEVRKFGGRKRLRRAPEIPKPPPIPAWFLKHNVKLVEGYHYGGRTDNLTSMRCVDRKTGHTLFTVSFQAPTPTPRFVTRAEREEQDSVAGDVTALKGPKESSVATTDEASDSIAHTIGQGLPRKDSKDNEVPQKRFFDTKLPKSIAAMGDAAEQTHPQPRGTVGDVTSDSQTAAHDPKITEKPEDSEMEFDVADTVLVNPDFVADSSKAFHTIEPLTPQGYCLLEAELGIHSGFSLLTRDHARSSSYAATRVDLLLEFPDSRKHAHVDFLVENLAESVQADLIRLDANDFEELTSDYVSQGDDAPGSFSNLAFDVFDGYVASGTRSMQGTVPPTNDRDEMEEDEEDEQDEHDSPERSTNRPGPLADLRKILYEKRHELSKALANARAGGQEEGTPLIILGSRAPGGGRSTASSKSSAASKHVSDEFFQWDDARLLALLDNLLDAPEIKKTHDDKSFSRLMSHAAISSQSKVAKPSEKTHSAIWSDRDRRRWRTAVARVLLRYAQVANSESDISGELIKANSQATTPVYNNASRPKRTLVHIRDLKDICRTKLGDALVRRLVRNVVRRRKSGEEIIIVGTSAEEPGIFGNPVPDDFHFRVITIAQMSLQAAREIIEQPKGSRLTWEEPGYHRILEINMRHVQSMLRRLRPKSTLDLFDSQLQSKLQQFASQGLSQRVLPLEQVQRLVLTAIGLSRSYALSDDVTWAHVMMATFITARVDRVCRQWADERNAKISKDLVASIAGGQGGGKEKPTKVMTSKVDQIRKSCNSHETRLLTGVVDAKNIKTGFGDVHVQPETIEALKTLTTLSLIRPEAFKYGVLANDRLPGLLLYGPPGTGKTLLAKAVAKDSKATVMEVSGAQIYEKYVGEGEKMVRAVFTLAKKLSPCVVFIDEADAIFGSRSNAGSRNTHREIINQFLREWDGLNDAGCFIMVATNRPFDLDDAVLRRLPRRLLVDLPVAKDRESILNIHLKEEAVDPAVSLAKLAEQTPLYSGSDLKNLCVSAALACVREENDLLMKHQDDKEFKLPKKRTLMQRHFETAISEISASINEDMRSLTAIRKFDEQYGDRKGRRKKTGYGFGAGEVKTDENSVRVRQDPIPAVPPPGSAPSQAPTPP